MMIYQSSVSKPVYKITDHEVETDAIAVVETAGSGSVTHFDVSENRPNLLPKLVYSSCALNVFENGKWKSVNIF